MARPQFQDIVPPDRKSIKKIPVPERASRPVPVRPVYDAPRPQARSESRSATRPPIRKEQPRYEPQYVPEPEPVDEPQPRKLRRPRKSLITIILIIVVLVALFGSAIISVAQISGATITITPKGQTVSVDSQLTAQKENAQASLQFQTVTIAKDGKMSVPANGEENAQIKASGTVVIYNNFSSAPQKLVANTRFETDKGLIFRIGQAVTIPGARVENGTSVPGSVEAVVVADAVGPNYNVGLADFTIPGFKGDPKYTKVYARAKTQIQGGFSGMRKKVDEAQITAAQDKIRSELKTNLITEARSNIPSGYVLLNDAFYIEYENLPRTADAEGNALIGERATFHGIIFKSSALAQEIAKKVNPTTSSTNQYDLTGIENLAFTLKSAQNMQKPWDSNALTFTINGSVTLVPTLDADTLKQELVGKPRNSLNAVLTGYPGIVKAEVTMRPFWKNIFPENKEEIVINVKSPEVTP